MNREDYNFDPMTGEKVIKDDYNFDPMTGEKIIKDDYNFDPMTGEKIVKTNEQSQQFNSEGYQPNNKIAIVVIVVVTVIFLAVASGFAGYFFGKRTQPRTKTCQSDFDAGGDKVVGGKAE